MSESVEMIVEKLKRDYAKELVLLPSGIKRKFSLAFKRAIVAEIEMNSISAGLLANQLGIGESTICAWKRKLGNRSVLKTNGQQRNSFQKLQIDVESKLQCQAPYLEGKSGVRIVGLSLSQMAEVLRYL